MRPLILFNPISGSGRARIVAEQLGSGLESEGLSPTLMETSPGPAADWLSAPLGEHDALVMVGGDGAVHATAPICAELGVPMLAQPAGTENLFAREVNGSARPLSAKVVAEILRGGQVRMVDLGMVESLDQRGETIGEEAMIVMASLGIDADVVRDVAARRTGRISRMTYFRPIVMNAFGWRGPRINIRVDGELVVDSRPGMVVVANSRHYAGRLDPARRAAIDDGALDVLFLPARSALGLVRWSLDIWLGARHLRNRRCVYRTGAMIEVAVDGPRTWQVDGDPPACPGLVCGLKIRVQPGHLPILGPGNPSGQ